MGDDFGSRYLRVVEAARNPNKDNWPFRYDQGLRLQRVEQGRRLVAETPVLPELKFMIDLENPLAKEAYVAFVSGRGNLVKFAAAWSDPDWKLSMRRTQKASLGESAKSNLSFSVAGSDSAIEVSFNPDSSGGSLAREEFR